MGDRVWCLLLGWGERTSCSIAGLSFRAALIGVIEAGAGMNDVAPLGLANSSFDSAAGLLTSFTATEGPKFAPSSAKDTILSLPGVKAGVAPPSFLDLKLALFGKSYGFAS